MDELPEITEVQRIEIRPGDRVVVRVPKPLDQDAAVNVAEIVAKILGLPDDEPVLVLPEGMSLEVYTIPQEPTVEKKPAFPSEDFWTGMA